MMRVSSVKGVTSVISLLMIVLIVTIIASSAFVFVFSYFGQTTAKTTEVTGSFCSERLISLYVKNIGTDSIALGTQKAQATPYDTDDDTVVLCHFSSGSLNCLDNNNNPVGPISSPLTVQEKPGRFGTGITR